MAIGIKMRRKGDTILISGVIDEFADLLPLASEAQPLKLNLSGITGANSLGIRIWIGMVKGLKGMRVEFYDCPQVFLDLVNMTPHVVHHDGAIHRIKSVLIPFECEVCKHRQTVSVLTRSVKVNTDGIDVPSPPCSQCGAAMSSEHDADDSFFFLTMKDEAADPDS